MATPSTHQRPVAGAGLPERTLPGLEALVRDLLLALPEHTGTPADGPLARLASLRQVQAALDVQIRLAAQEAAAAGANYAQLGEAWNITRQGARKRWPGLVFARPRPTPTPGDPEMSTPLRSYTVLLVEDDDADAMLIEEALLDHGVARTIQRAGDGIAALAHLRDPANTRPDLMVLDLNMPRMNGRELLTVLKNDEALSTVPVVVLTTSAAPDDVTRAYQEHANAYVTKPVNLDDFIQAVQSIDAFFLDTATPPRP
ncbi:response regulator [Streptacidiphilus sp. N1-3]|uniref:Response regulator n=1 Tax=Streptacidiphilus alkalitolerans TaxID=3342712 RepID=A0ABV6XBT6_9ACTN